MASLTCLAPWLRRLRVRVPWVPFPIRVDLETLPVISAGGTSDFLHGDLVYKRPRWKQLVFFKAEPRNGIASLLLYSVGQSGHPLAQTPG